MLLYLDIKMFSSYGIRISLSSTEIFLVQLKHLNPPAAKDMEIGDLRIHVEQKEISYPET